ncbi:DUF4136 domain-containing protein [Robertkochia flava]|uniref:DUF4136 domain-containing protein n=1 Tax=Robertkochia flava TaxID=3447986 RepID=UPI001CCBADAA|nr:DUF4136 domain-containing protein [Robertkochia marina]
MIPKKYTLIATLAAICLLGCAAPEVITRVKDDSFQPSEYRSFGFYEVTSKGDTIPEQYDDNLENLKEAISLQLRTKGLIPDERTPDILINLGIVVEKKVQTRETDFRTDAPRYIGQRNYSWKSEEVVVRTYREGTLDIHLVDAKNQNLLWQCAISGVIPESEKSKSKKLDEALRQAFSEW